MKGHIRQRTKGSWTIVIDVGKDPETGKRMQKWHTIRGTKRDADRTLREMLLALEKGTYVKPTRLTVGEWLIQWLETYAKVHITLRTQESYSSTVRGHLVPSLGSIPLTQLRPQHLENYYARALSLGRTDGKGGLSARSVLYHHRILSEALGHAVKMGYLARNVAEVVKPPRPARAKLATLEPDDISRFLDAARQTPYYVLFSTLLYTGLRRGEALALKWRCVDLDMASLYVVDTAYKLHDGTFVIKEPKTAHSRRSIALSPSLALLLRKYREDQVQFGLSVGRAISDDDFVFTPLGGGPLDPDTVSHAFAKLIRKAGLPHIRLHDLRHSHATLMLKAGIHPKIVSERLGHSSIAITLDIYSHVLPGLQEAAAERFDRLLETNDAQHQNGDVSKMLAKEDNVQREPRRTRTSNQLIKSQLLCQLS